MVATFISGVNAPASGDSQASSRAATKPAGATIGVFFVSFWNFAGAITPPSGAILRSNNTNDTERTATYIKYVDGDATGTTYTFSWTGSQWSGLKALFYSDVDLGLDLATVPFDSDSDASGTNFPTSTVNTLAGAALAWHGNTYDYSSTPSTHTPPTDFIETGDTDGSSAAYRISPSTGSQSAAGATYNQSLNKLTSLVAIAPSGGGGTQTIVGNLISAAATLFNPSVVPGSVVITTDLLSVSSTVFNPSVDTLSVVTALNIAVPSTVFEPSIVAGPVDIEVPLLSVPSTLFEPNVGVSGVIAALQLDTPSTLFEPTVLRLLEVIQVSEVSVPSTVFSPFVSGGDGGPPAMALASIADIARDTMLVELGLVEPQLLSNVDLCALVREDGTQTTFTLVSEWTPAKQYWEFLRELRDA